MKSDETISEMYDRFVEIIGGIKSLGKTFTNEELVKKILRSLPKEGLSKVTSLKDSKDLSKVQLDELLGNLIDYEITFKREQVEEPNKAKKTIAFKVSSENSSDEDDEFDEKELALMTRRIRKMLFQNKKFIPKRNFKKDKGESNKRDPLTCFECNKPGHIRTDCPKLKKPFKKFKKKALKATWNESSDSEDEEIVNALKVMNDELELTYKRNKLLKSELASLRKENETSTKVNRPLDRKDKLDTILDSQRSPSIKYGLSYSKFAQAPLSKTIFVKASSSNEPSPQVPSPKVSNLKGQEPKKSYGNETRKTSFHQYASRQNVCLKSSKLESKWYLDSECSRHMTGNANPFLSLEKKDGDGQVTFGDNGKGNLDELTLEDSQSSGIQDQHMEDPLKDLGVDQVELQKQQGQQVPHQEV
ncbi:uncharacterized protein LOC131178378 [Hevea brasiliensis]|uniref:uncharacterized protein LOC131178378 n=1 Tax=Hevea brasiliensis TaxID=3981 RepID=UPI0025CCE105|nr:uncharacterized protein LOC131178378 [Hevea brasiliensis]